MAHEIEWTESALADLAEAVEFIARDSSSYAASLATRADHAAETLREFPQRGRRVPESPDPAVRELFIAGRYRLIYRIGTDKVSILAFVHGARVLDET